VTPGLDSAQALVPSPEKVRLGLIWLGIKSWSMRLSSLLLFMLVGRLLSADQLGLFAAANVMLILLGILSEQGFLQAVVQRPEITPAQMNAALWVNVGVSAAMVVIIWLAAPAIAALMDTPGLVPVLRVASFSLPFWAASYVQEAMRRRTFEYRWIATTSLISTLVSTLVALAMMLAGLGVWGLVAQTLVGAMVSALVLWLRPAWRASWQADFRGMRPLMSYGCKRLTANLLEFGNTRYIEIFLAVALGPAALAMYTIGIKLPQALMQTYSSTVVDVAHSGFSRLAADRVALAAAYTKGVCVISTLAMPVFLGIAAMAPPLVVVLFGAKWAPSAEVMRGMALLGAVQVHQLYNISLFNAIGRPGIGLQFMVVKVVLTFGALALARDGGMTALLNAYILSQLATLPLGYYLMHRLVGVSLLDLARRIGPLLLAQLVLMAVAQGVQIALEGRGWPALLVLLLSAAASAASYLAFLALAARATLRETLALVRSKQGSAAAPTALDPAMG
jgi:O-antigen/teichoic acid export membrane protein